MSGSKYAQMAWNTKEIREFKAAFAKRQQASFPASLLVDNANTAYAKASAMLLKRKDHARGTLDAIQVERDHRIWAMTEGLNIRYGELLQQTSELLRAPPRENTRDDAIDADTRQLVAKTDEWVGFEAQCISARNEMTAAETDENVGDRLSERAQQLRVFARKLQADAGLLALPPQDILTALTDQDDELGDVLDLLATREVDTEAAPVVSDVAKRLDDCKVALQDLATRLAEQSPQPGKDQVLKATLESVYDMNVTMNVMGVPPPIPYQELLKALAMVPVDHSTNALLKNIVFEKLKPGVGGDYSKSEKRIRVSTTVNLQSQKTYKNPETGEDVKVNGFSATTLHEIGHAVDHAYGIMTTHGKDPACGGWLEVDPIVYVQSAYDRFVRTALAKLTDENNLVTDSLAEGKPDFINYMSEALTPDQFIAGVEQVWSSAHDVIIATTSRPMWPAADKVSERIHNFFALEDRGNTVVPRTSLRDRLGVLIAGVPDEIALMTTSKPPVFTKEQLSEQFNKLPDDPQKKKKEVEFGDWVQNSVVEFRIALTKLLQDKRNAWAAAIRQSLPPAGMLKPYKDTSYPWNTDLSNTKIAGQPASHQAYPSNTMWWRYSNRSATYVSDYQWRAPSEWFAELYAVTWLTKVEPPSGVGKAVRPYFYGGHVAPPS